MNMKDRLEEEGYEYFIKVTDARTHSNKILRLRLLSETSRRSTLDSGGGFGRLLT